MSKIIEQNDMADISVEHLDGCLILLQKLDSVAIDERGASELIKVLQEWVGDD